MSRSEPRSHLEPCACLLCQQTNPFRALGSAVWRGSDFNHRLKRREEPLTSVLSMNLDADDKQFERPKRDFSRSLAAVLWDPGSWPRGPIRTMVVREITRKPADEPQPDFPAGAEYPILDRPIALARSRHRVFDQFRADGRGTLQSVCAWSGASGWKVDLNGPLPVLVWRNATVFRLINSIFATCMARPKDALVEGEPLNL